jgi:septum site-determining protein MinD
MRHIISVLSGKGGVGKTCLTAAMGVLLAKQGFKTLLIDCDMGLRNLDLSLGIENECFYNVWDLAQGKCFEDEALVQVSSNLWFLSAAQNETWDAVDPSSAEAVLEDIMNQFDFILLDCPAGRNRGVSFAEKVSDTILAVLAPTFSSLRAVGQMAEHKSRKTSFYVLMNQFDDYDPSKVSFETMLSYVDEDYFCGVVPYSPEVRLLDQKGQLSELKRDSNFSKALMASLHTALTGSAYPLHFWKKILAAEKDETKSSRQPEERRVLPKRRIVKEMIHKKTGTARERMNYKWGRRR